jgi:hypothetical protein
VGAYLERGAHETSQRHNPTARGTSATFPNVTAETDVTVKKCQKPLRHSHCDVVTFQNGGNRLDARSCDHCRRPGSDTNPLLGVGPTAKAMPGCTEPALACGWLETKTT